ncbi:hypothetical protein C8R44DRAFT_892303 [Mycena epipterygia]|nr:hypothetical protein C8R44DRAFT_892303 [Mycena epipterygia]
MPVPSCFFLHTAPHIAATAILVAVALPRCRRCAPPPFAPAFPRRCCDDPFRLLVSHSAPAPAFCLHLRLRLCLCLRLRRCRPPRATPPPAPHLVFCAIIVSIGDSIIINDTPLHPASASLAPPSANIGCDDGPGVPLPRPEALAYQPAYARVGAFSSFACEFIGDGPG